MITITEILSTIETYAEHALVQELRLIKDEVLELRPFLSRDEQDHVDALLLKLDRLMSDQVVIADALVLEQGRQPAAHVA